MFDHGNMAEPQIASAAFQSRLQSIASDLSAQQIQVTKNFDKEHNLQGFLGKVFDDIKNRVGTSDEDNSAPGWLWAQLFNRSAGSESCGEVLSASKQEIEQLKQAAAGNDLVKFGSLYQQLTGQNFDENKVSADALKANRNIETYHTSQANGVEFLSDLGSIAASLAALRLGAGRFPTSSLLLRLGTGFIAGAAAKTILKQIDGTYASLPLDLLSGGLNGLAFPAAESASLSFGGEPFKHGLGVAAGSENATRTFLQEIRQGQHIDGYKVLSNAFMGYGLGYASTTALFTSLAAVKRSAGLSITPIMKQAAANRLLQLSSNQSLTAGLSHLHSFL